MGLLLGRLERRSQTGPTFPEPIIPPFPDADPYGMVTIGGKPDRALSIPTVWACVNLLSSSVGMLPLEAFRRTSSVPERLDPQPPLLLSPSGTVTASEWLTSVMVSLLTAGNAYGRISGRDKLQRPTQIDLLDPTLVQVVTGDDGATVYKLKNKVIPTSDLWHVRGMLMPGSTVGLSPLRYAALTMGVDAGSRKFASDFFGGSGVPKSMISSDRDLTQEQARSIKDRFIAAVSRREPLILGAGLTYKALQVTPEESQFLATQQFSVQQIARFFGIPAEMVGGNSGNSNTYANVEQRGLEFLTYSVGPWLRRLEESITALLPAGVYVRFDTTDLLRTDQETRTKIFVQQLAGRVRTPTEIRGLLDLPPMTDAQKAEADLVPLTVTPMGSAKALPAMKNPTGAPAPVPVSDQQPQGA